MSCWTVDCIAARQLDDDFHDGVIEVGKEKIEAKLVWNSSKEGK